MVGIREFGTYDVPPGTWSDDTSLTLCLVEALLDGIDPKKIAQNFIKWAHHNWWTPHGEVFEIGISTEDAIQKLVDGVDPTQSGGIGELDNGIGSLMRILPLVFSIYPMERQDRFHQVNLVSSITHGHIRSVIACFYYLEFVWLLIDNQTPQTTYKKLQDDLPNFLSQLTLPDEEIQHFSRLLVSDISLLLESEIHSSGYVVHTLEASIWCLLTSHSFQEAVLKAVNLGDDTDTTAAVTGGLAALCYGVNEIPTDRINTLLLMEDIIMLAERWAKSA